MGKGKEERKNFSEEWSLMLTFALSHDMTSFGCHSDLDPAYPAKIIHPHVPYLALFLGSSSS
jgi:hypothetical protein